MTIKKPERRQLFQLLNNFEQVNAGWDCTILILLKSPLYFPIKNVWTCSDLNASYGRKNEQVDFFFFFEKLTRPYTLTTSLESKKIIDL